MELAFLVGFSGGARFLIQQRSRSLQIQKQDANPGTGFCSMYTEHDLGDAIKKGCRRGSLLWSLWVARAAVGSTLRTSSECSSE